MDKIEHSVAWKSALGKLLTALDEQELRQARAVFEEMNAPFVAMLEDEEEEPAQKHLTNAFFAWLVAGFMKDNRPVVEWFLDKHGSEVSENERQALLAAGKSVTGIFSVRKFEDGTLELVGLDDRVFIVDTIDLEKMERGTTVVTILNGAPGGRYFLQAPLAEMDEEAFRIAKAHKDFMESWSETFESFIRWMGGRSLSERALAEHEENLGFFLNFLEEAAPPTVDSFRKVTKKALKKELKEYRENFVVAPKVEGVYKTLLEFFRYLRDEGGIENKECLEWLAGRGRNQ